MRFLYAILAPTIALSLLGTVALAGDEPSAATATEKPGAYGPFVEPLIGGVIGLALGAIGTLVGTHWKERRGAKRLTYQVKISRLSLIAPKSIEGEGIQITYNGQPADDLHELRYQLTNSCRKLIKGQKIRIELPANAEVISNVCNAPPERGLEAVKIDHNGAHYLVKSLPPATSVDVCMLFKAKSGSPRYHHSNDEEKDHVQVVTGSMAEALSDSEVVARFLVLAAYLAMLLSIEPNDPLFNRIHGTIRVILWVIVAAKAHSFVSAMVRLHTSSLASQTQVRINGDYAQVSLRDSPFA